MCDLVSYVGVSPLVAVSYVIVCVVCRCVTRVVRSVDRGECCVCVLLVSEF